MVCHLFVIFLPSIVNRFYRLVTGTELEKICQKFLKKNGMEWRGALNSPW
jgi:hypothetical protein